MDRHLELPSKCRMVNAVDRTLLEESIAPTSSGSGLVRVVLDGGRDECDHYQGSRKGGQRTATRCTFRGRLQWARRPRTSRVLWLRRIGERWPGRKIATNGSLGCRHLWNSRGG